MLVGTSATAVTPIQKVIMMLEDMLAKGTKEKQDEEVRFASFSTFCANTQKSKEKSIASAKADLEQLAADIQKADADAMEAGNDIAALNKDIGIWEADKSEATEIRKKEHEDFEITHEDYEESISAIERAMATIKAGPAGQVSLGQTSLLEISSSKHIPAKAKKAIMSFLQQDAEPMSALMQDAAEMVAAPEAAAFESSSGGIIQMIEGLDAKFNDEKDTLEKEESEARHAYDMTAQQLTDQIEAATREVKSKKAFKSKRETDKAAAEGDAADTTNSLNEDEKYLSDLVATCEQKAADFAKRQELRQGELDAINKAIEIMSSDAVSGSGDKHLPGFVQKSTSLAQLRSHTASPGQRAAAAFLNDAAQRSNSRILSLISIKVTEDPFKKVTKMIKDMIIKLTEEATEEAEHKGFCDTELTTNKQTRDFKTEEATKLKADIEKLTADIAQGAIDISELGSAIAEIDAAVAKATEERNAEKEKNQATIADAKAGQVAVAEATKVLKEFYDKAATATALVQAGQSPMPETFDEPYTGMAGGGVLGMLEVCQSDFARLEADTTAAEDESAKEYGDFMSDSAVDKATKEATMKHKEGKKTQNESDLQTANKDLVAVNEELDAAMEYYEKLKPSCVDAGESYEERVARRKAEIESLQEALKILSD
jgi:hypothetical protein